MARVTVAPNKVTVAVEVSRIGRTHGRRGRAITPRESGGPEGWSHVDGRLCAGVGGVGAGGGWAVH